jgi:elongation factor 1-beta
MGNVAVSLRVVVTPGNNLNTVKEMIKKEIEIKDIKEEPVGFGIMSLKVLTIIPDAEGGTDILEEKISKIKGVDSVEVDNVTLI